MANQVDYRVPTYLPGGRNDGYPDLDVTENTPLADLAVYARYSRALWDEQETALQPLHQTWMENLLFLTNRQWHTRRNGQLVLEEVPSWRKRPVVNLCLPFYRTFLAKVTKNRPAMEVVAASADPEDVHASELAKEILEAKHEELKIPVTLRRALAWTIVTGNGYLYPYWNTSTGKLKRMEIPDEVPVYDEDGVKVGTEEVMVPLDEDGEPILGEDGRPPEGAEPAIVDMGDIAAKAPSPFHVRVDPDAEDDSEVTWFITADVMTLRAIQRRWPEVFEDPATTPSAEDVSQLEMYTGAMDHFADPRAGRSQSPSPVDQRDRELPKALVLTYHEMPTKEHPNGRYWTSVGSVVLDRPQDLPEGIWPGIIHLTDVVIPGRYHAASTFESIVYLNREYNEINADIQEHHAQFIAGKWKVPNGSGLTKTAITRQPGEVLKYNLGFPPEQIELKALPTAVYAERERVQNDYQLVGGIHRVSMGAPPPGVTAGVAFLQLQEADDTDLGPFLAMMEEAVAQLASAFLRIIKIRYTQERLVMVTGPNRKYMIRAFRGSDLAGAVDVRTVAESSFPRSRTAQQSMLLSMLQQVPEFFTDPETGRLDRTRFAQMLPIGGLDSFASSQDVDIAQALSEEELFYAYSGGGDPLPEPSWYDDHEVHYNVHRRTAVSGAFRQWSPPAQEAFLAHLERTKQMRDQARAEKNIANGGTPPGAQAPPGPDADPGQMMERVAEGDLPPVPGAPEQPAAAEQEEMVDELEAARAQTGVI